MIFARYLQWLGLRSTTPVAGLHITDANITLVAVRPNPTRIVAVGRRPVTGAAVIGNEVRLAGPVVTELRALMADTRIAPGTATIAAVEPMADSLAIWDSGQQLLTYNVAEPICDQIEAVTNRAGLWLARVDLVPVAMARLARQLRLPTVAGMAPNGWTVSLAAGFIDAARSHHGAPSGRPLGTLDGIGVPKRLTSTIDPAGDAAAIGAALAGLGAMPLVPIQAVPETAGADWVVQHIDDGPSRSDRSSQTERETTAMTDTTDTTEGTSR